MFSEWYAVHYQLVSNNIAFLHTRWWRGIVLHWIAFTIPILFRVVSIMRARHVLHPLPVWEEELHDFSIYLRLDLLCSYSMVSQWRQPVLDSPLSVVVSSNEP